MSDARVIVDFEKYLREVVEAIGRSKRDNPHVRPNYRQAGHSSVNMAATTFSKKSPDTRDIAEKVDQEVPHDQEFAPPSDGAGDKTQEEQKIEGAFEEKGTVGPLDEAAWEKYKQKLGQWESGNDYGKVNTIGFVGRWQFGAPALIDLGYVKHGVATRALFRSSSWTGKDGISSREAFLGSTKVQNSCILRFTRANYKTLLRLRVVTKSSPVDEVGGYLAAAHLKGCGGARKLKNGIDNKDAYGTHASKYYNEMKSHLNGSTPSDGSTPEEYVNKNTQPDAAQFAMPSSGATPQYGYNSVREFEGGHFKEYDSTPGSERIQERHKTGTGYEIQADGSMRNIVKGDNYTAVLGNDYIMVQGSCQIIVNGDCGLRVNGNLNHSISNDYNLLVGGRMNLVVAGDKHEIVNGNSSESVTGDKSTNVGGFHKIGVDGDIFSEAASYSHISKDGNVNLGATKDINVVSMENVNTNASGSVSSSAKKQVNTSSGEGTNITSKGDLMAASTGGKSTVHGSSETVVHSGGAVKIDGSAVNVSPYVDRSYYSIYSAYASALGHTTEPPEQGSSGAGDSGSSQEKGQKNTDEKKVKNALDNFQAFEETKTQAYGGGSEGELHGYDKGFKYDQA